MPFTREEVEQKEGWLVMQLDAELRKQFNDHSISIGSGLVSDGTKGCDFAILLIDMCHPNQNPGREVVSFVANKVQELIPGSQPYVKGVKHPRI